MWGNTGSRRSLRRPVRTRGGFTLVEVLVVVGILIILISITVPVVSKARQQAAKTKCQNNLRALGQAVLAFEGEHNATLPTCGSKVPAITNSTDWVGWGGTDTTRTVVTTGMTANTDYMNECGLAKYLGFGTPDQSGQPNLKLRGNYQCPSVSDDQHAAAIAAGKYPFDYQFNAQLSGMPLDRVDRAGEKGLIVEDDNRDDSAYCWWSGTPVLPNASGQDAVALRHGGVGGNCLFADGHVGIMVPAVTPAPNPPTDFVNWDAYYTQASPNVASQPRHTNADYGPAN